MFARSGGISSVFASSGLRLRTSEGTLGVRVVGVGRGGRLRHVRVGRVSGRRSLVVDRHGPLTEWYRTGPFGLEQGFVVRTRSRGPGHLVVGLQISGSLRPHHSGSEVTFAGRNDSGLSYGGLTAVDATGRELPAWIELRRGRLLLWVDDRRARYPIRIDPFFQQGAKLTASDETGASGFGQSVAMSSDGSTALIGAPDGNAAWVFTRSGSAWTQQGSALTVPGAIGFGASVALSSDGNTALIGATGPNSAYVFTRSGSTWTQQGSAITPSDAAGNSSFGASVALSSDGNTALIGGPSDNPQAPFAGAAWVFTRSGSIWTQQGSKLTGTGETGGAGGSFGSSVALSSDGNTALIGGNTDNSYVGAAWVFTRSGSTWTQQGSKLTGDGEMGAQDFGSAVALSADGNTAIVGGSGLLGMDVLGQPYSGGAAWVFTRSGSTWSQQGSKLTVSDETDHEQFGASVALSSDGNTAIIGGPSNDAGAVGGAWAFSRSGSAWDQLGARLSVTGGSGTIQFGSGVAISGDGTRALVGGPGDNSGVGASWGFQRLPGVSTVSPSVGPPGGGTVVTITGADFSGVTGVKFVSTPAASFTVDSSTQITATSPVGSLGPVDIRVTDAQGTSPVSAADEFAFATAPSAPTGVSAVAGLRQATVQFTAPAANGSPITSYTVTASPGGATASGTGSPITVTGLGDWTAYTFTVTATNAAGTGASSQPSSSVTTEATTQTALTADHDPSFYGTPLTFTATVTSVQAGAGTPTGDASFTVTGEDPVPETIDANGHAMFSPFYYLNVGDTVTADYGGDAAHDVSAATFAPNIKPAVTAMSLTSSQNPATTGSDVTITATVTNTSTTIVPFGTVHFVADGQPLDAPLDENGQAVIEGSGLNPGDQTITATYHDDTGPTPDFVDSQATLVEHINTAPPPAPVNSSPPSISGTAVRGGTLTAAHGAWTNNPTAYNIQWEDCDLAGNTCSKISGATSQTYMLTGADVGHTIRVEEIASNAGGSSTPATSKPTGVVEVPLGTSGAVTVGRVNVSGRSASVPISCTGEPGATCKLTLVLTIIETIRARKVIAVTAANTSGKLKRKLAVLGNARLTLSAGQTKTVKLTLNQTGKRLLVKYHALKVKLAIHESGKTVSTQTISFKAKPKSRH